MCKLSTSERFELNAYINREVHNFFRYPVSGKDKVKLFLDRVYTYANDKTASTSLATICRYHAAYNLWLQQDAEPLTELTDAEIIEASAVTEESNKAEVTAVAVSANKEDMEEIASDTITEPTANTTASKAAKPKPEATNVEVIHATETEKAIAGDDASTVSSNSGIDSAYVEESTVEESGKTTVQKGDANGKRNKDVFEKLMAATTFESLSASELTIRDNSTGLVLRLEQRPIVNVPLILQNGATVFMSSKLLDTSNSLAVWDNKPLFEWYCCYGDACSRLKYLFSTENHTMVLEDVNESKSVTTYCCQNPTCSFKAAVVTAHLQLYQPESIYTVATMKNDQSLDVHVFDSTFGSANNNITQRAAYKYIEEVRSMRKYNPPSTILFQIPMQLLDHIHVACYCKETDFDTVIAAFRSIDDNYFRDMSDAVIERIIASAKSYFKSLISPRKGGSKRRYNKRLSADNEVVEAGSKSLDTDGEETDTDSVVTVKVGSRPTRKKRKNRKMSYSARTTRKKKYKTTAVYETSDTTTEQVEVRHAWSNSSGPRSAVCSIFTEDTGAEVGDEKTEVETAPVHRLMIQSTANESTDNKVDDKSGVTEECTTKTLIQDDATGQKNGKFIYNETKKDVQVQFSDGITTTPLSPTMPKAFETTTTSSLRRSMSLGDLRTMLEAKNKVDNKLRNIIDRLFQLSTDATELLNELKGYLAPSTQLQSDNDADKVQQEVRNMMQNRTKEYDIVALQEIVDRINEYTQWRISI